MNRWAITVEGAVDYCAGRFLDANPYSRESASTYFAAWERGWQEARGQARFEEEAERWRRAA